MCIPLGYTEARILSLQGEVVQDRYNSLYFKELPKGVQRYFNSIEIAYSFMWVKISNDRFEILQNMLNNE